MSITRLYQCDLCDDRHEPHQLRGLYWKQEVAALRLVEENPMKVEHHICEKCLEALRDFKVRP